MDKSRRLYSRPTIPCANSGKIWWSIKSLRLCVGTDCLQSPPTSWSGKDTYIQQTGINQDFGLFNTPDQFYAAHHQDFGIIKNFVYQNFIRHWMNARVRNVRRGNVPDIPNKKGAQ